MSIIDKSLFWSRFSITKNHRTLQYNCPMFSFYLGLKCSNQSKTKQNKKFWISQWKWHSIENCLTLYISRFRNCFDSISFRILSHFSQEWQNIGKFDKWLHRRQFPPFFQQMIFSILSIRWQTRSKSFPNDFICEIVLAMFTIWNHLARLSIHKSRRRDKVLLICFCLFICLCQMDFFFFFDYCFGILFFFYIFFH